MIVTDICKSIEGEKLTLQCRKFNAFKPRKDSIMKQQVFPFKMGISSIAIINEELNPKNPKYKNESMLDKDLTLMGESIDGFSMKPLGTPNVEHGSGAHKASILNTRCFTYAHIEIGFRRLL
jgi:hypothetical protein